MLRWMLIFSLIQVTACSVKDKLTNCPGRSDPDAEPGGSVVLTWNAPLTRTNGSPIGELSGYKIYYGTKPDELRCEIEIGDPKAVAWRVTDLSPGNWYFAVVSVDSAKVESKQSGVVTKQIE